MFDDPEEERLQGREQTQEPDEWKTGQDDEADLLDQPDRLVAGLVLKGGLEEVRDVGADGQEEHMNGPGRKATMEPFSAIRILIIQTLAFYKWTLVYRFLLFRYVQLKTSIAEN